MKPEEFAEALGRANAAGMIEAVKAGIFGASVKSPHTRSAPRRPKKAKTPLAPVEPKRVLAGEPDHREDDAYSVDAARDEEGELQRLEQMFRERTGVELNAEQSRELQRRLNLSPYDERGEAKGTYDPDHEPNLAAKIIKA